MALVCFKCGLTNLLGARDCCLALSCGAMGLFAVCDLVFPEHTHFLFFTSVTTQKQLQSYIIYLSIYSLGFEKITYIFVRKNIPFSSRYMWCLFCFGLVCFFTSQSTPMVMPGWSAHLSTLFFWANFTKPLTSISCTYLT